MTNKTVKVTRAQVRAAKLIVDRASRGLGVATPALKAIANAKPSSMAAQAVTEDATQSSAMPI